jgi:F5/8 type C domain
VNMGEFTTLNGSSVGGGTISQPEVLIGDFYTITNVTAQLPYFTYRLYITANNGSPACTGVGEFELWTGASGTGTNLSPASKTLITFSDYQGSLTLNQNNLTDSSYAGTSQYLSQYGVSNPHWVRIDFASAQAVMSFATGSANDILSIYLRDFLFQYSPDGGTTWRTVLTVTGKSWSASERIVYNLSYPGVAWP